VSDDPDHTLDAIDGALADYDVSPDAMRWSPEPEKVAPQRPAIDLSGFIAAMQRLADATYEFKRAWDANTEAN
jgi:hypothetical protein